MKTVIIDYGSGNLHSAAKAFERAVSDHGLAMDVQVTADAEAVRKADRVVLPGVGAFADCRAGLDAVTGMVDALHEVVIEKGRPFLGICVGTQLMAERGLEKTVTPGFGWIGGDVVRMTPSDPELKIPQIGWNTLEVRQEHPLLSGIPTGPEGWHAYFLHGFHLVADNEADVIAVADYGGPVTAIVARGNIAGTQFHPEKSQKLGLAMVGNFLTWMP